MIGLCLLIAVPKVMEPC